MTQSGELEQAPPHGINELRFGTAGAMGIGEKLIPQLHF
jgi:hypothetical protein